jgi:hypothetical protein
LGLLVYGYATGVFSSRKIERATYDSEYRAKMGAREEKAKATGRKPGGKPPQPPTADPSPKDQVNPTDAESRIPPVAGGGFAQADNAQATVATGS